MASRTAATLRRTGPHRVAAGLVVGLALAWRAGHPSIPMRSGAFADETGTAWAAFAIVLLLILAAAGLRLHPSDPQRPRAFRIVARAMAAAAAAAALVLLVVAGSWFGAALATAFLAIEILAYAAPWQPARRVPFEAYALVGEGMLAPLIGYAALARQPAQAAVLAMTVPNALALALAASLGGADSASRPADSLRTVLSGPLHAALALAASTAAAATVIFGVAVDARPELALLAVPVAAMAVVFGWLALLDPRAERREQRVGRLVTIAGLALAVGVGFVLVFA